LKEASSRIDSARGRARIRATSLTTHWVPYPVDAGLQPCGQSKVKVKRDVKQKGKLRTKGLGRYTLVKRIGNLGRPPPKDSLEVGGGVFKRGNGKAGRGRKGFKLKTRFLRIWASPEFGQGESSYGMNRYKTGDWVLQTWGGATGYKKRKRSSRRISKNRRQATRQKTPSTPAGHSTRSRPRGGGSLSNGINSKGGKGPVSNSVHCLTSWLEATKATTTAQNFDLGSSKRGGEKEKETKERRTARVGIGQWERCLGEMGTNLRGADAGTA